MDSPVFMPSSEWQLGFAAACGFGVLVFFGISRMLSRSQIKSDDVSADIDGLYPREVNEIDDDPVGNYEASIARATGLDGAPS